MKRAYYYLFYKLYKMSEAAPSRWLSDWKAGISIMALELFSVMSIANYYNVWINRNFRVGYNLLIPTLLLSLVIKYVFFIHSDKWKSYVSEFDKLPKYKNKQGTWIVFGIIAFIIANLIFSFYLMGQVDWKQYR